MTFNRDDWDKKLEYGRMPLWHNNGWEEKPQLMDKDKVPKLYF